ncbi:hypothetical protein Pcinc_010143 [Petrolisthes cinctipes]|uniref:Uncharacterized protein n=1 Tax=Petrolisthes cinctipes TaxID=88211 RepID=A0AAE1G3M8_PETCI|nr:hypothetical protein Pcinc_010143 [Petrolisthes cinctipes]
MEIEAIKVLLEAQNNSFKSALDVIVEQLNSRIEATEETVRDLTRSLEFSQAEVKDLQSQVIELVKKDNINKDIMETLKRKICELEQRSNYQEDYNRRCNLRFSGVPEQRGGETWEVTANTVTKLLQDKLQLPPMQIERAHRTGQASHVTGRSRTIVARFERYGDREAVVRNAKKLRGTGIFINDDLCPASLELRKNQMPRLKQAKEDGKIAFFRHTKLIIREKNEAGGVAEPVSRDGDDIEIATRQSLPASAGERLSAAAARDGNGGGAAAVVDSDDGAAGAGVDGGAVAPLSVTGVAMSPAGGVPSPGRRYAAAASAGDRGVSGVGEGATQRQVKYLRSRRK